MAQKKDFKYYLMIFGIAMLAILLYTVIGWISSGEFSSELLLLAILVPTTFTVFLFLVDTLIAKLFPKRLKKQDGEAGFDRFVKEMNVALNNGSSFTIQDYRELQDSEKFQKTLKQLFTIKTSGESEDLSLNI